MKHPRRERKPSSPGSSGPPRPGMKRCVSVRKGGGQCQAWHNRTDSAHCYNHAPLPCSTPGCGRYTGKRGICRKCEIDHQYEFFMKTNGETLRRTAVIMAVMQDYGFCPESFEQVSAYWETLATDYLETLQNPTVKQILEVRNTCSHCGGNLPIEVDNRHLQAAVRRAYQRERQT